MLFLRVILAGKKTYLVAGCLLLATVVLLGTGHLDAAQAVLLLAVSLFPATFRAALEQHHQEELATLIALAKTGVDLAGHNLPAAARDGEAALASGLHLVSEMPLGVVNSSGPAAAILNAVATGRQAE